jgi:hypothetical protein
MGVFVAEYSWKASLNSKPEYRWIFAQGEKRFCFALFMLQGHFCGTKKMALTDGNCG